MRAVWLAAVLLVCAGARPALADGVFNYDSEKVTAFFIEVLVVLAAVVFALILLVRWLGAKVREDDAKLAEPSLPAARAVNIGPPAGNDATATARSKAP
jgi:heme A synthase